MRGPSIVTLALPLALVLTEGPAPAYQGGAVANGGSVTGTVKFEGKRPKPAKLHVTKDHGTCGHSKPSEELIVAGSGALKNAVVYLEGVSAGKPAQPKEIGLDQKNCVYSPHVQATVRGSKISLTSSDPILHNVHGAMGKRLVFNVAMPMKGQRIKKKLRKPGLVTINCDAGHTWMRAYVHVFSHPYFAVTGADGSFKLDDVPPGTYKLVVWHEKLGQSTRSVTVKSGGAVETNISLR